MNLPWAITFISGIIFIGLGGIAIFSPHVAGEYYGLIFDTVEGKTTIRAFGGFNLAVGMILSYLSFVASLQKQLLVILAILLLGFAIPRLLGLALNGMEQPKMLGELAFEMIAVLFIAFVYWRKYIASRQHP